MNNKNAELHDYLFWYVARYYDKILSWNGIHSMVLSGIAPRGEVSILLSSISFAGCLGASISISVAENIISMMKPEITNKSAVSPVSSNSSHSSTSQTEILE